MVTFGLRILTHTGVLLLYYIYPVIGDICVLYRLELILPTLNLSVEVIKVVLG